MSAGILLRYVEYDTLGAVRILFVFFLYISAYLSVVSLFFYAKAPFLTSCMTAVFSQDCSDHPIKYPMVLVAREILEKHHALCFFFRGLCFWRFVVPGKIPRGPKNTTSFAWWAPPPLIGIFTPRIPRSERCITCRGPVDPGPLAPVGAVFTLGLRLFPLDEGSGRVLGEAATTAWSKLYPPGYQGSCFCVVLYVVLYGFVVSRAKKAWVCCLGAAAFFVCL